MKKLHILFLGAALLISVDAHARGGSVHPMGWGFHDIVIHHPAMGPTKMAAHEQDVSWRHPESGLQCEGDGTGC